MNPLSIDTRIQFKIIELKPWEKYTISWAEIITVVNGEISDRIKWILHTFESSVYYTWTIEAITSTLLIIFKIKNEDIILNKINVEVEFWEYCRKNWKQLRKLYDVEWFEKVDLYRSNQVDYEFGWEKYKFNLWFCGKETNCRLHNQHNFIEVHTNIAWDWYMQKFWENNLSSLVETVWLLPWNSHRTFNIKWEIEENGNPKYPFHRWLGGTTWNIWAVVEKY